MLVSEVPMKQNQHCVVSTRVLRAELKATQVFDRDFLLALKSGYQRSGGLRILSASSAAKA